MSFSPDAPIEKKGQDRLGRTSFSQVLARALQGWREKDSLVIGLFGGWGSGKTSLKNLAVNELQIRSDSPVVVHFNPWLVSRPEQIAEVFFREIGAALAKVQPGESAERAHKRLSAFAAYLSAAGVVTGQTLELLSVLGVPGAGAGAMLAKGISGAGEAAKKGAEAQKQLQDAMKRTLPELKEELRRTLDEREQPILVVVDDVDRLASDEICLLFKLIKANADFPRFIYLVLCDRVFVTEALNSFAPGRGAEFLEKIIQVSFDIPPPDWKDIEAIALSDWESILRSSRDADQRSDHRRWNEVINLARPYLQHIRSIRRWMNAVRFSFSLFRTKSGFDANPEDILAIELLRIFEPALYEVVSRAKVSLTYSMWDFDYLTIDEMGRKAERDRLLANVPEARKAFAGAILDWLFPNARWTRSRDNEDDSLLRDLRVADRRCFDRYFRFVIGKESLSRGEIRRSLKACACYKEFAQLVQNEHVRGRLSLLLNHLSAHAEEVAKYADAVVQVFFDMGDELPNKIWIFGGSGLQGEIVGFLFKILEIIPCQRKRSELLLSAIDRSKGLMLPFFLGVYECSERHRQSYNELNLIVSHLMIPELKQRIVKKIKELKDAPALIDAESFGFVLARWKEWEGSNKASATWLQNRLKTRKGLWQVLRSASSTETSQEEKRYTAVNCQFLSEFVPLEIIDAAVENIELGECDEEQKQLLEFYRLSRRKIPK